MSLILDCVCSQKSCAFELNENSSIQEDSSCQPLTPSCKTTELLPLLIRDRHKMIDFESDPAHYEHISIVGRGMNDNAIVSAVRHNPSGEFIAIKRVLLDKCKEDWECIQREIVETRQLQHPNILPYLHSFVTNNEVWTITPLMTYGSARDLLDAYFKGGFPEIAIAFILKDVLKALDYIHKMGIIHRSIRASHILISGSGCAYLTGFRYSYNTIQNGNCRKVVHQFPKDCVNNLNWLSPEMLQQNLLGYDSKSDIYSAGITACELANGLIPFSEMPSTKMLVEKLKGTTPRVVEEECGSSNSDDFERKFSVHFHDFVIKSLTTDPELRPSASQFLNHPVIKQCKKSSVTFPDIINAITPIVDISCVNEVSQEHLNSSSQADSLSQKLENFDLDVSWTF